MRHPTFFAQAWPRLDHQVYWSDSWLSTRKASTQPTSSNNSVSQARSSGRKPEFFWLPRQFLRSISLWAMFQSPQMMYSRPLLRYSRRMGMSRSMTLNLICWRSSDDEPDGMYSDTTDRRP